MNNKNLKLKSALLNPYISCLARLPVYVLIASAFFGAKAYFVVAGLYLLGLMVALMLGLVLNKTILKSKGEELLLEFPPLRGVDFKHVLQVAGVNAKDFVGRVFGVVVSVGVIIWLLTHTKFNLSYTQNISNSILFNIVDKITFIFAPIGLNNTGIVCALFVGVLAKELIVSTISIANNATTTKALVKSLTVASSVVSFSLPSAVSFLVFVLLYSPCASNIAVLKSELGKFWAVFAVVSQLTIAYLTSFVVYLMLTKGFIVSIIVACVVAIISISIFYIIKKLKKQKCLACGKCTIN